MWALVDVARDGYPDWLFRMEPEKAARKAARETAGGLLLMAPVAEEEPAGLLEGPLEKVLEAELAAAAEKVQRARAGGLPGAQAAAPLLKGCRGA